MKIKRSELKQMVVEILKEETEYQKFFRSALEKFGVKSQKDFTSDEEEKKFWNFVDKNWQGSEEAPEEKGRAEEPGEVEEDVDETLEFPSFSEKQPQDRIKAFRRKMILADPKVQESKKKLKISERMFRKMINEELRFVMFNEKPGTLGLRTLRRRQQKLGK